MDGAAELLLMFPNLKGAMDIGIFVDEEKVIRDYFLTKFFKEVELFNQLLDVYVSFLKATSGKIKDNDYPNWTILILLSQTLPLMNNGLSLLVSEYLRSSEIMIRVASEAMILSVYFKEFPDVEVEYRSQNYRDFFHNYKIEEMLKRVEKRGTIFIKDKVAAKKVHWNKIVFLNLFKESSRFLHNDPNLLYDLIIDNIGSAYEKGALIMGPQQYSDESLSMGLRRLLNVSLFSLVAFGVSLNIYPNENEKKIMEESSKVIEKLNKIPVK